jgi:hypothetical protein
MRGLILLALAVVSTTGGPAALVAPRALRQAALLRVLEERTVTRLGPTAARPVDVRFIGGEQP